MKAAMTVMSKIDVLETAHRLVEQRGTFAKWTAKQRAEALLELGDMAGYQTFIRVMQAVEDIGGQGAVKDQTVLKVPTRWVPLVVACARSCDGMFKFLSGVIATAVMGCDVRRVIFFQLPHNR